MLVISVIAISLTLAALVAYPIIRKIASKSPFPEDESSIRADLERRWESALEGLRHAELEMSVGNVSESDYLWLKPSTLQQEGGGGTHQGGQGFKTTPSSSGWIFSPCAPESQ